MLSAVLAHRNVVPHQEGRSRRDEVGAWWVQERRTVGVLKLLRPKVMDVAPRVKPSQLHHASAGLHCDRGVGPVSDGVAITGEELADLGWIEEIADAGRRPDASERKRYYGLTRAGRAALDAETQRLADLVRLARSIARRHA